MKTEKKLFYLNFEKILETCSIQTHSILESADHDFIQNSNQIQNSLFSELELAANFLEMLTAVKFFKVGILAFCFSNGSLRFYNESSRQWILEYKVGFQWDCQDNW